MWITFTFASRFLNKREKIKSTNKLELLGVVWATEDFKNHLYGSEFAIETNHKAFLSALKTNHGNKSRVLTFNFKIKHIPGKEKGFTKFYRNYSQEKLFQFHIKTKILLLQQTICLQILGVQRRIVKRTNRR